MTISGTIMNHACTLKPGDENIELDFGNVVNKNIYQNQRTDGDVFTLNFEMCDSTISNGVKISFSGLPNQQLPELLALSAGSQAKGIAIGLETLSGEALPINTKGKKIGLVDGDNAISFKAYIKGEPSAIERKEIQPGAFIALASFEFSYD
ncbi:fimbrial protein [Serratia nevei]|uniref:fimbrial protein n=1 Tax=Serratia nevei TaxID=2703794 RepID=UPI003FA6C560